MAFEYGGVKRKKAYQIPFLEQVDGPTPKKYRFCNWDKYDPRDAFKDFIHFNSIRNQEELDENYKLLDEDPEVRNYLIAAQGQYRKVLQDGINTYVNKHGELTNTALKGIKDPRPKHVMGNSNPLSLVICDYYKFDNQNRMADVS